MVLNVIPQYCIAHPLCAQMSMWLYVCVHIRNMRDFPQAKLNREINARFLFNGHSDQYFLFNSFSESTESTLVVPKHAVKHVVLKRSQNLYKRGCERKTNKKTIV